MSFDTFDEQCKAYELAYQHPSSLNSKEGLCLGTGRRTSDSQELDSM